MKSKISSVIALVAIGLVLTACLKDESILSYEKQMEKDIAIIDDYLASKGITAEIHESGLRYVIHDAGSGTSPVLANSPCVAFDYEGRLLPSESIFGPQASVDLYPLIGLIEGFQEGLPLIAEGGSITLYIPSRLGYGPKTVGPIPKNSNLIFDVDLTSVGTYNETTNSCE